MPAKDGLIILKRSLANNSQNNRRSNFCSLRGSRQVCRCHEENHGGFLAHTKAPYSGGENATFISKTKKRAPGFKAGRDKLTLLLCANAVRFMIRTGLIYKANP